MSTITSSPPLPSVALSDLEHFVVNSFWHFEGGGAGVGLGSEGRGEECKLFILLKRHQSSPLLTFDIDVLYINIHNIQEIWFI